MDDQKELRDYLHLAIEKQDHYLYNTNATMLNQATKHSFN